MITCYLARENIFNVLTVDQSCVINQFPSVGMPSSATWVCFTFPLALWRPWTTLNRQLLRSCIEFRALNHPYVSVASQSVPLTPSASSRGTYTSTEGLRIQLGQLLLNVPIFKFKGNHNSFVTLGFIVKLSVFRQLWNENIWIDGVHADA